MSFAKQQIARQFSRAAESYDDVSGLQIEMAEQLMRGISVDSTGMLVDLGCGTGWAMSQFDRGQQFNLVGIDLAPGMIKLANELVPSANFHCCDLESTPLADNFADVVFSNAAIQWCDPFLAFSEMFRICKPGGTIHVSTFGSGTIQEIRSAWEESGDTQIRTHEFESRNSIAAALNSAGFTNSTIEVQSQVQTFKSIESFLGSIKKLGATNAATNRQPGLLGREKYKKFRSVLEQRLSMSDRLTLTYQCIYICANKPGQS